MEKLRVLSLFDGISCGQLALQRAGIPVEIYFASEIDKYAIQITQKNFPNTIQMGDVRNICFESLGRIDLLMGGSPCQGFSFAGKQLNFEDPRSKLFFEFVRALKTLKPKYFLLENVKMKQEYQDVISEQLGVQPVEINSSLVSAQSRKRLYWTNISKIALPEDKGILLKDIVLENTETDADKSYCIDAHYSCACASDYFKRRRKQQVYEKIKEYIVPFDKTLQILDKEVQRGKLGFFKRDVQSQRVYFLHNKAVTLCGEAGGGAAKMGQYLFGILQTAHGNNSGGITYRGDKAPTLTSSKYEHNNYVFGCITPDIVNKTQNGQRFNDGNKFYTLTTRDRHGVLIEGYIRKLTPVECERLQTLPDEYTAGVSNAQRYKCLGNAWTVDVIAHIFSFLKEIENDSEHI